jgi:hypothetical protein
MCTASEQGELRTPTPVGGPNSLTRTADQTVEFTTCHHQINRLDGICQTNL